MSLDLDENRIGNEGAQSLAAALDTNRVLKRLMLDGNTSTWTSKTYRLRVNKLALQGALVGRLSGRQAHPSPRTPRRAAVLCGVRSTDIPA
jgi:hypothetical protein